MVSMGKKAMHPTDEDTLATTIWSVLLVLDTLLQKVLKDRQIVWSLSHRLSLALKGVVFCESNMCFRAIADWVLQVAFIGVLLWSQKRRVL